MTLIVGLFVVYVTYYAQVDPALHKWFENLRSPDGAYCCAETDGIRLQDPDWGRNDKGYYVVVEGQRVDVPKDAVIKKRHPAINWAIVWILHEQGKPFVRCFLPGSET